MNNFNLFSNENSNRKIKRTKDYHKFSFSVDNRPLNLTHVHTLTKSIEKYGQLEVIKVNSRGVIKEGQHRFTALKNLGEWVEYYVSDSDQDNIIEMNTVRLNWQLSDYLNFYVKKNDWGYERFNDLVLNFNGFSVPAINKAVGCSSANFKNGHLQINETSYIKAETILLGCESISGWFDAARATSFVAAISEVSRKYKIDVKIFFGKATMYKDSKMHHCTSTAEYRQMIIKLWNYKSRNKIQQ